MLDRRDNIEPCHANTCQWILELEKYKSWRSQSCGLLWIKGKPGAGKSTLMAFLHDTLKTLQDGTQGIRLDFFFSARGTELQRTPLGMFRSLLNQIFDRDISARPLVRETYEQRCRQFGSSESKWEWPRVLLEELLAGAILASANRQSVTVFVDALDEAGAESAQQLTTYFHRLIDRAGKKNLAVQICISCRHYPIMGNDQAMEINVEDHNYDDISTYIKDTLTDMEVEEGLDQETREVLMQQLIQQANGVFQWAHLIMPLVCRRILEGESFDETRLWLRDIPAGLDDVYTYILNKVIEYKNWENSFLLFQWICLAERPLTVTEMRYALAASNCKTTTISLRGWEKANGFVESNERMKRRVKTLSGGLTEVVSSEDHDETIQVIHQSVNDFFRAKGLQILHHHANGITLPTDSNKILFQCQASLYRSCMVYLATIDLPQEILEDQGKEKIIQVYSFLNYATTNLFIHAEKAAGSRADAVQNESDMLQRVINQWIQTYRVLNPHDLACPAKGTTLLHIAAATNLVDIIEPALLNGEDVTREDENRSTALHLAARWGHIPAGKILLDKGADHEARCRNGRTPLIEAARRGNVAFVEWLLLKGVTLESTRNRSQSALQAAAFEGHQDVVEILLGAGAKVNAQGGSYGNALQAAAYGGSTEVVRMLLSAQANVNAQGGEYGNALQAAAYQRSSETVRMLLNAQADVNAQGGLYGNALQAAALGGSTETVRMLLNAQANVNAQGGEYGNALQAAAYGGSTEIVRMLLDAQADVNAQGGEYGNALQAAAYGRSAESVRMLLDAQADVNAQSGEYGNALQAAAYGRSAESVRMLLDAQADVNAQGGLYGNALQAAAYQRSSETVRMLLNAQADVNAQGGLYGNALQAAAYEGSTEVVRMLLSAQANVNAQGGLYGNALQAAALGDSTETVRMLLNVQADVNSQSSEYGNALQAAVLGRSTGTVRMLLDVQADVNAQGGLYGNALQAAAYEGSTEVVRMLLSAQANINAQGGSYGNALQAAAYGGSTEVVRMLLSAQANVNAQGGEYGNALQAAALGGSTEIVRMLLDAQADVNAQSGPFGSPLSAAVHENESHVVQILLDAGADVLLTDDLGHTPLHIASSRDMLHILHQFPQLALAVNSLDRFSQSPLHLAVHHGHIEFALMLLDLRADPSLMDGYGRNIMDWTYGNQSLMHQIRPHCPQIILTPIETQKLSVRLSVFQISDAILHSRLKSLWPLVQQLGRYFLFLDELDNARYLFQLHLLQIKSENTPECWIFCEFCKNPITDSYFVCKICAHVDLCSDCIPQNSNHHRMHPDQQHEIFEVPNTLDNCCELTGSPSEQMRDFLRNLIRERSVPDTHEIEMESSLDSVPDPAFDKTSLASRTFFDPVILVPSLLFAFIVVMLGYSYF
ncbi:uncharacterized protein N7484_007920 [Penicillium longicatenatum]|uniref:uncharacterized protein n=1 Tax=Penicillium longicatenatum TaxID=1561947 RepID=UPI0025490450|nr:uncharacterized protein N7484_007920 [Penicillium longicatenatum]KAJ5640058.1 hypothetical protein N7484_007920 [Penicillium longicatenatum]